MFDSEPLFLMALICAVIFALTTLLVAILIRGTAVKRFHERQAKFLEDFNNDSK